MLTSPIPIHIFPLSFFKNLWQTSILPVSGFVVSIAYLEVPPLHSVQEALSPPSPPWGLPLPPALSHW